MLVKMPVQTLANMLAGQHLGQNLGQRFHARARPNIFENRPTFMGWKPFFLKEKITAAMPTHAGNGFVVSQQTVNPATNIILASTIAISSTTSLTIAATRSLVIIIITTMI